MLFGKQKSSHHRSWRGRKVLLLALSLCVGISAAAHGQASPPSHSVRCPSPADPRYLYFECVGRPIDFIEETLTKDWGGFRTELNRTWDHADRILYDPAHGKSRRRTVTGIHLQRDLAGFDIWDFHRLLAFPAFRSTSAAPGPQARTFRPIISATILRFRARTPHRVTAPIISPWARSICSSNCLTTHW